VGQGAKANMPDLIMRWLEVGVVYGGASGARERDGGCSVRKGSGMGRCGLELLLRIEEGSNVQLQTLANYKVLTLYPLSTLRPGLRWASKCS